MRQHHYSIFGKVQIEFQCVCSCLDSSFNGTKCIFRKLALVASVGDCLGKAGRGMGDWRMVEVGWTGQW